MPTSRLVLSAPVGRPYARTLGHTVRLRPSFLLTRNRRMARATGVLYYALRGGSAAYGVVSAARQA